MRSPALVHEPGCAPRARRRMVAVAVVVVVAVGLGCGTDADPVAGQSTSTSISETTLDPPPGETTVAAPSTGSLHDTDAGAVDAGSGRQGSTSTSTGSTSSTGSTGPGDTSSDDPLDGLGALSGECGTIDAAALESAAPAFVVNAIDFARVGFDYEMLTAGGQEVFDDGNLGGNSLLSEVIAFEVLARCETAALTKTETEIVYTDPMGIKTDLLVALAGYPVGVSVTRAIAFPFEDPYGVEPASMLLTDKLQGVIASSANVAPKDAWTKQILHVVAYGPMHAESLQEAYDALPASITADTIVMVTITHGDDAFIYE